MTDAYENLANAIILLAVNLAIILTYNRYFESRYKKILG